MSAAAADAIAAELGISCDLFLRTRKDLERRGFPRPLPLGSRGRKGRPPLRWSLDAVRDWIRNPRPQPANDAGHGARRDITLLESRLG